MTHRSVDCDVTHDDAQDSTTCYPLAGGHLQVAAILGHVPHGGRVRLTVTELGQIGELVAREQCLVIALYAVLRASGVVSGLRGSPGDVSEAYEANQGVVA